MIKALTATEPSFRFVSQRQLFNRLIWTSDVDSNPSPNFVFNGLEAVVAFNLLARTSSLNFLRSRNWLLKILRHDVSIGKSESSKKGCCVFDMLFCFEHIEIQIKKSSPCIVKKFYQLFLNKTCSYDF